MFFFQVCIIVSFLFFFCLTYPYFKTFSFSLIIYDSIFCHISSILSIFCLINLGSDFFPIHYFRPFPSFSIGSFWIHVRRFFFEVEQEFWVFWWECPMRDRVISQMSARLLCQTASKAHSILFSASNPAVFPAPASWRTSLLFEDKNAIELQLLTKLLLLLLLSPLPLPLLCFCFVAFALLLLCFCFVAFALLLPVGVKTL